MDGVLVFGPILALPEHVRTRSLNHTCPVIVSLQGKLSPFCRSTSKLLLLFLISLISISSQGTDDGRGESPITAKDISGESLQDLKTIQSHVEKDIGPWLNGPMSQGHEKLDAAVAILNALVLEQVGRDERLSHVPIRVHIFLNTEPNAWVRKFTPYASYSSGTSSIYSLFSKHLNAPTLGFIELGITTGLLEFVDSLDALALVIGHELGHVAHGHLDGYDHPSIQDLIKRWWSGQADELVADAYAIQQNSGLYDLEAHLDTLDALFRRSSHDQSPTSVKEKVLDATRSSANTHPHEGVRIGAAEVLVRHKKMKEPKWPRRRPMAPEVLGLPSLVEADSSKPEMFLTKIKSGAMQSMSKGDLDFLATQPPAVLIRKVFEKMNSSDLLLSVKLRSVSEFWNQLMSRGLITPTIEAELETIEPYLDWWFKSARSDELSKVHSDSFLGRYDSALFNMSFASKSGGAYHRFLEMRLEQAFDFSYVNEERRHLFRSVMNSKISGKWKQVAIQVFLNHLRNLNPSSFFEKFSVGKYYWEVWPLFPHDHLRDLFENLRWLETLPEGQGFASEVQDVRQNLKQALWSTLFQDRPLPVYIGIQSEIRVRQQELSFDRISDGPTFYTSTNFSAPPFDQITTLQFLENSKIQKLRPQLKTFFQSLFDVEMRNPEINARSLALNTYSQFFISEMDSILAEIWMEGALSYTPQQRLSFLTMWAKLRSKLRSMKPDLDPRLRDLVNSSFLEHQVLNTIYDQDAKEFIDVLVHFEAFSELTRHIDIYEFLGWLRNGSLYTHYERSEFINSFVFTKLSQVQVQSGEQATLWFREIKQLLPSHRVISIGADVKGRLTKMADEVFLRLDLIRRSEVLRWNASRHVLSEDLILRALVDDFLLWREQAPQSTTKLDKQIDLYKSKEKSYLRDDQELMVRFQNALAERLNTQPQDRALIDSDEETQMVGLGTGASSLVRQFSGLLTLMRSYPVGDQIVFMDYLSGATAEVPPSLYELNQLAIENQVRDDLNVFSLAESARLKMANLNTVSRALVLNSFFAGPSGILRSNEGLSKLRDRVLMQVSESRRPFVEKIFDAMRLAEGRDFGFLLAFALAQKTQSGSDRTESSFLKALLESYGVPGVKFGQTLSFLSDFDEFKAAFDDFQDTALPVSYLGLLKLLERHVGVPWDPERFHLVGVVGSGSANIAVKVLDKRGYQVRVINVLRSHIETQSNYDFMRFQRFVKALLESESGSRYGFLPGLGKIIEDFVRLEFDKARAHAIHSAGQDVYSHRVGKWRVVVVESIEAFPRALLMQLAPGESAKKVKASDPELYKEAMLAYLSVAEQQLRGKAELLLTDLDIHNGQFFIDKETRTVTLLDKGQASLLTQRERSLARVLMRIASFPEADREIYRLNQFGDLLGQVTDSNLEFLKSRLTGLSKPMDRYIELIARLRELGPLPASVVSWGFEYQRTHALASQLSYLQRVRLESILLEGTSRRFANTAWALADTLMGRPRKLSSKEAHSASPTVNTSLGPVEGQNVECEKVLH